MVKQYCCAAASCAASTFCLHWPIPWSVCHILTRIAWMPCISLESDDFPGESTRAKETYGAFPGTYEMKEGWDQLKGKGGVLALHACSAPVHDVYR